MSPATRSRGRTAGAHDGDRRGSPRGAEDRRGDPPGSSSSAPRRRRITAADVARAAGVSATTVSYVLNDTPGQTISAETRRRVLEAADTLDYIPSAAARSLPRGHDDTVLWVMSDRPPTRFSAQVLDALSDELGRHGLTLTLRRRRPGRPLAALWRAATPAAVVALDEPGEPTGPAADRDDVLVLTAPPSDASSTEAPLGVPYAAAGAAQVRHLAGRGHRHLVLVHPHGDDPSRRAWASGARSTCRELGLPPPAEAHLRPTIDAAGPLVESWRARSPAVTGALAYDDELGGALLGALRGLGLGAPDDLAVIGLGDDPLGRFTTPALSTVRPNPDAVAARLAAVVVAAVTRRQGPSSAPPDGYATLLARDST